jgi:hypothetical protein
MQEAQLNSYEETGSLPNSDTQIYGSTAILLDLGRFFIFVIYT